MGWRWIIFDRLGLKWSSDDYSWCLWHFTSQRQYERISTCLVPIDKANFRNRQFFTWIVFGQNVRKLISKVFFVPLLRRRRFGRIFQPIKKCHKFRKIIFGSRKLFFKIRRQNKLCDTNIRFLHFYSTEETTIFRNLLMGESPCNDFWKYETLA